jgi:hypothetical protein
VYFSKMIGGTKMATTAKHILNRELDSFKVCTICLES